MLDRKTKDIDASLELLEDRKKQSKLYFYIFFIIGWNIVIISGAIIPYKYDEIGLGLGISLLIFAICFFNNWNYLNSIIIIKNLKLR